HTRSKRDWSSDVCSSDLHCCRRRTKWSGGSAGLGNRWSGRGSARRGSGGCRMTGSWRLLCECLGGGWCGGAVSTVIDFSPVSPPVCHVDVIVCHVSSQAGRSAEVPGLRRQLHLERDELVRIEADD